VRARPWFPVALVVLCGCATTKFENEKSKLEPASCAPQSQPGRCNAERRALDATHEERPLILVAISGGGVRASALGWAILEQLKEQKYRTGTGETRRLIDDVAVVSSASGGSVPAAYLGLYGPDGLDSLEGDFLRQDNMQALSFKALRPDTWFSLIFSGYGRTDQVRQLFDDRLFHGSHFSDMNRKDRPYVILNATDMAAGEVFSFTPQRFDDICSNLDDELISVGVASSSAVPIVLAPMAFRNFSGRNNGCPQMPEWVTNQLDTEKLPAARFLNVELYKQARYTYDLRKGDHPFRTRDYIYLVDGGVVDNLGIHGLIEATVSNHAPEIVDVGGGHRRSILYALNDRKVRKLVVVVVNARSDPVNDIYTSPDRPGLLSMFGAVASDPIDAASSGMNSQLRVLMSELKKADLVTQGMKVYDIEVDFDLLDPAVKKQKDLRDAAKIIPTSWTISAENLVVVKDASRQLMQNNPCFQKLLLDLGITPDFPTPAADNCQ
jgi:NTE family protein